jgi:hypothetical protein
VLPTEPIRPLKDVWLRPRRVFRELAARPVGITDYLLAAAQGIGNFLALYRTEGAGAHSSVEVILAKSFAYGAIAGVASLFLMAVIYRRLGTRAGGKSTTSQVIHVLAYGGVPMVASLAIWVLTALLAGEATFVETPRADIEAFLALLLHVQFISYVLLLMGPVASAPRTAAVRRSLSAQRVASVRRSPSAQRRAMSRNSGLGMRRAAVMISTPWVSTPWFLAAWILPAWVVTPWRGPLCWRRIYGRRPPCVPGLAVRPAPLRPFSLPVWRPSYSLSLIFGLA